jgi:small-conductance mechanosensitive channel
LTIGGKIMSVFGNFISLMVDEDIAALILDDNGELNFQKAGDNSAKIAMMSYERRPGFFTPYTSPRDAVLTLFSPLTTPLVMGLLTALSAAIVVLATAASLALLLATAVVAPFNSKAASDLLDFSGVMIAIALGALVGTIAMAVTGFVGIALAPVQILTRAGATIGKAFEDLGGEDAASPAFNNV